MILINGEPENRIDASDRGLLYGDGLFETLAYRHGRLEFLDAHLFRLEHGCQRLAIPFTDWSFLKRELAQICDAEPHDGVIKIILTRGTGGRGYKTPDVISPVRILSRHPMPTHPASNQLGVSVRLCQHRLAINPALAGIKHLNRLEQVLARNEWHDQAIAEGLMLDLNDHLIEGTMSNLFIVKHGKLLTPSLVNNGIHGIMRAEVMKVADLLQLETEQRSLTLDDLLDADEVFLTNSIIGVWPVIHLTAPAVNWPHGEITRRIQQAIEGLTR